MVQQFMDLCVGRHIHADHAAMDATGAGRVLHDIIAEKWSPMVLAVQFGGAPSERPVGMGNQTAKDLYDRRVSELWHVGIEYIRAGQIRNLTFELANEMKARHYEHTKTGGLRIKVESKTDMKSRVGFSPDIADSYMILLELARTRFHFQPGPEGNARVTSKKAFLEAAKSYDAVNQSLYSEPVY